MTPTRPGPLLAIAVIAAVVAWVVVRQSFATLPPLPWTAVPAMLLLAVREAVAGHNLRARLTGRRAGQPLEPIAVARMAALAKASSAAAAALAGLAAGFAIYVTGLLDKAVPRHDAYAATATVAAAIALLSGAL
ncbi:MAG: DUF3180 family protein, partial [Streptosporangiaceae bacterium]